LRIAGIYPFLGLRNKANLSGFGIGPISGSRLQQKQQLSGLAPQRGLMSGQRIARNKLQPPDLQETVAERAQRRRARASTPARPDQFFLVVRAEEDIESLELGLDDAGDLLDSDVCVWRVCVERIFGAALAGKYSAS